MSRAHPRTRYCSFCGASEHEVRLLIGGPTHFICAACVSECNRTLAGERPVEPTPSPEAA